MSKKIKLLLLLFFLVILSIVILNLQISKYRTDIKIEPNLVYKVEDRTYKVPDIKMKGKGYLLKEDFLVSMRTLYNKVKLLFQDYNVEYWLSGGTLLGFIRHQTFMPWDDDIDMHTYSYNRLIMFTGKFKDSARKHGLECMYMRGMSETYSYYKGGIRFRESSKKNPVMDIFFVEQIDEKMKKIENWSGKNITYNNKEIWEIDDILELKKETIDDLDVFLPNNSHNVLKNQYGETYKTEMHCDEKYHTIAHDLFGGIIWRTN